MKRQQRLDLQQLHQAIEKRDQEQLQFLLKRLLQSLDYYIALAVPLERVSDFLPIFEAHYPEETWVRQLLLMINNYGKAPENDITEMALQHSFNAPGMGNFLKAVFDITQAMQDRNTPEARVGFMASAVVNAIMAQLVYRWYGEREKAWEQVRDNQTDEQATRIAYIFWTHPDTIANDQQYWREIADSLHEKLTRLETHSS
ncbi:MAG: hypothetical protein ACFE0Q_01780 [Anaerolineae bacterium]